MSKAGRGASTPGRPTLRPGGWRAGPRRRLPAVTAVVALAAGPGLFGGATAGAAGSPVAPAAIPVGLSPYSMAVDPSTHTLYVGNSETGASVSVIDEVTRKVTATISGFGASPLYVAVDPSTHYVYVADGTVVTVVDGAPGANHNKIIATVPIGDHVFQIAVDPTTHDVYVIDENAAVSVIDTTTNAGHDKVVATLKVGYGPAALAVDPRTHDVYVVSEDVDTVSVIDGSDDADHGKVVATVYNVGNEPDAVAIDPTTHAVYVANQGSNTVSVIDGADDLQKFEVITTVTVSRSPDAVAVDPSTHAVYVASQSSPPTVSLIAGHMGSDASLTATRVPFLATQIPTDLAVDLSTHTVYAAIVNTNNAPGEVAVICDCADVGLTVTGPSGAADGTTVTERVTVTNNGPGFAPSISTDLSIPPGLSVTSAPGAVGGTSAKILKWTDRALAPGARVTHPVSLSVASSIHATVALRGVVIGSVNDPEPANNITTATIRLG